MSLSCDACALSGICLPSNLSVAEITVLEANIHTGVKINKGDAIYTAGERFTGLYAVKSGSFKSVIATSQGDEQIVGFHMPGELLGFDGFDSSHANTTVALETAMVCKVPEDSLEFLCNNVKGVSTHVHKMVASDVRAHNSALLLIAQKTAEERIVCFLKNVSDRFKKRGFSGSDFSLSMPRGDIANFLGMAPETVSRLFARLEDEEIVRFNRREVHIINEAEMSNRACGHGNALANKAQANRAQANKALAANA
ncbi:MAG: cyclic nucleotide-binding domain-containing protein [Arenicellales bacterium]